jgi:hypothetical protein
MLMWSICTLVLAAFADSDLQDTPAGRSCAQSLCADRRPGSGQHLAVPRDRCPQGQLLEAAQPRKPGLFQRARARCTGSSGNSGGPGYRSSRYSQTTVESASVTASSISTGMRRTGLMAENSSLP